MFTLTRRFTAVLPASFALVFSLLAIPGASGATSELVMIRGSVIGSHGSALNQVTIEILDCEESQLDVCALVGSTNTDVHGEFELQVAAGVPLTISFETDDNLHSRQYWTGQATLSETLSEATAVTFGTESDPEINVQLSRGAAIFGSILDHNSNPADGADIVVKNEAGDVIVKTGRAEESEFVLGGLAAGTYVVDFVFRGLTTQRVVEVTRGESKDLGTVYIADQLANISPPTITGDALVGSTLTAHAGTWSVSSPAFTYRWFADDDVIGGAESASYVVTASDVDQHITVEVTATAPGYAPQSVMSAPTDQIALAQIENDSAPSISGTPKVGGTLTADPGSWTPADVTLAYQWLVDGNEVNGASNSTFQVQSEHAGKLVTLEVTASKADWESATEYSDPVQVSELIEITNTAVPVVSGSLTPGATLTASTGQWAASEGTWDSRGATFTYEWFLDETKVEGVSDNQYTVPTSAIGKRVTVSVTVSKIGYQTSERAFSATSTPIEVKQLTNTALPTVWGNMVVGATIKSSLGQWNEPGVTYTYRWFANGVMISGATKSSYKLPAAHAGKRITVGVAVTKPGFKNSVRIQSEPTARILHNSTMTVKTKNKKKRKIDFTVTVKSNKKNANGYVELYRGTKRIKTVKLNKGKSTIKLSGQPAGKHKYTLKYVGWGTAKATQKSVTITTKK